MHFFKVFLLGLLIPVFTSTVISQNAIHIQIITENADNQNTLNQFGQMVQDEILTLLQSRYDVSFQVTYGNYQPDFIQEKLDETFQDDSTDIVIAIGSLVSGLMLHRDSYPKPTIAGIIIDTALQNAPITPEGTSGINNFTYIQTPFNIKRDIQALNRIQPFKKLGVVGAEFIQSFQPFVENLFSNITAQFDASYQFITLAEIDDYANPNLPPDVDAFYFLPMFDYLSNEEQKQLLNSINQLGLPSAALIGEEMVENGVLISYESTSNIQRIPRRIAINVSKIAEGINPSELPVGMPIYNENLLINMAAARKSGVYPDWGMMSEALLVNYNQVETDRVLSLKGAIAEALQQNLSIKAAEKTPLIGQTNVDLSKAQFLPQVDASTSLALIDKSSTESSFGARGRLTWVASTSLSQLLYSEPAMANVTIQKLLQKSNEYELQEAQLNTIQEVAIAYLNVLQAESFVRIQHENVRVTQENYDISKAKEAVGYSGASDLNRWQSELALKNIDLNDAQAQYRQAKFQVNQLLNRPINEAFKTENITLGEQSLLATDIRITAVIDNYGELEAFADFLVLEGMKNWPELKQFDYGIAAQERLKLSQQRAFYLPSVAMSGQLDYIIDRVKAIEVPGVPAPGNDPTWNLGIGLQYPIFQGGQRKFDLEQTRLNVLQLQDQRTNTKNLLELQIRSALETAGASFSRVELSKEAAEAARKNFDIVQDSYSQGLVNITTLIDAQNAAIQTELSAVNAIYTFIADFINVERAVGAYYFLATDEERDAFFQRLVDYLSNH